MKKAEKSEPGAQKERKRALIAAQLAPPEEWTAAAAKQEVEPTAPEPALNASEADFVDGSVIVDGELLHIPHQMIHPDCERRRSPFHPVLIVVLAASLSFTAFVAYLISLQPK